MATRPDMSWPFFDTGHAELFDGIDKWAREFVPDIEGAKTDVDDAVRTLVAALGKDGWLRYATPASGAPDVRSLCIIRETLARYSGLADFAFAMQALGSGAIVLFGDAHHREKLTEVEQGRAVTALAISERDAGSNVAALSTTAAADGKDFVLNGEKTWISNAGIADFYVIIARTGEAPGAKGLSAFLVDADAEGLSVSERIEVSAPHPLGTLRFEDCRVPASALIAASGDGFKVAMSTLDVFRPTVGAAAVGFARRALELSVKQVKERVVFDRPLAEFQMTQDRLAQMVCEVEASALMVYRAAWMKDTAGGRVTRESSLAKLYATEAAQRVIDSAVQLFGGHGVVADHPVEKLYREIRPLRIYEGTSEIQKLIVARETLKEEKS